MAGYSLVIVESPTKAKTIRKFLPSTFKVEACIGHIRDLPQSAADIPAKYKKEPWATIGVDYDNNFEPLYLVPKNKKKIIKELKAKLKNASTLYLATDEDREGESISWHLLELLKPTIPVKRMVFHEITKAAIQQSLKDTRTINTELVSAQETRRILDRLVGYTLSPLIWKKIAYGLSAGRVQSVATKIITEREKLRFDFIPSEYWDLLANLNSDKQSKTFPAKIKSYQGQTIALGKDFDDRGKLKSDPKKYVVVDKSQAEKLAIKLKKEKWIVNKVEKKPFKSKPPIPFITSTFQQEANRKLGMGSRQAMQVAQRLYEQGLITYMRTDSPNLSKEGTNCARSEIKRLYGNEYLSDSPRTFAAKSKGAQEAHEAIRPAGTKFTHPDNCGLTGREKQVYDLIWKRTIATQMKEARKESLSIVIDCDETVFQANGTRILFPGFLRAYVEGSDNPEAALGDQEVLLPDLKAGDSLKLADIKPVPHKTKPIARYTEASLIQKMEKEGIGRPSTYASIVSTIMDRGYVDKKGHALAPTFVGLAVNQLLEKNFPQLIDLNFTSEMEETLDDIAAGEKQAKPYLKSFYLGNKGLKEQVEKKEKSIDPDESRRIRLASVPDDFTLKVGRYGAYIEKDSKTDKVKASIPYDVSPSELTEEKIEEIIELSKKGPVPLGKHPETKEDIYVLQGRFGPYVQLGEITEEIPKPKRASIPKNIKPSEILLEQAVHLLILPRTLGNHPDTGVEIISNTGRFGPYIGHQKDYRSLKAGVDDVYEIDLKRALEIFSQPKRGRGGSVRAKDFGEHEKSVLAVYVGKFGPFLKFGKKNISIPKDIDHEKMTKEEAIALIAKSDSKTKSEKTTKKVTKKKTTKKKTKRKTTKKK